MPVVDPLDPVVLAQDEEPLPVAGTCRDCDAPATRSDGRCDRHSALRLTRGAALREAREALERRALRYADIHATAAEVAALKGDGAPSQWALERLGVVEPPDKHKTPSVVVQVGVVLPGLSR